MAAQGLEAFGVGEEGEGVGHGVVEPEGFQARFVGGPAGSVAVVGGQGRRATAARAMREPLALPSAL